MGHTDQIGVLELIGLLRATAATVLAENAELRLAAAVLRADGARLRAQNRAIRAALADERREPAPALRVAA